MRFGCCRYVPDEEPWISDLRIIGYNLGELKSALEAVEVLPCSKHDYMRQAHLAHLSHSIALPKLQSFKLEENNKKREYIKSTVQAQGNQCAKCVKCAARLNSSSSFLCLKLLSKHPLDGIVKIVKRLANPCSSPVFDHLISEF